MKNMLSVSEELLEAYIANTPLNPSKETIVRVEKDNIRLELNSKRIVSHMLNSDKIFVYIRYKDLINNINFKLTYSRDYQKNMSFEEMKNIKKQYKSNMTTLNKKEDIVARKLKIESDIYTMMRKGLEHNQEDNNGKK